MIVALEGNPQVTTDRTSFSELARLSTRSKPLSLTKTAGQQPGLEKVKEQLRRFRTLNSFQLPGNDQHMISRMHGWVELCPSIS